MMIKVIFAAMISATLVAALPQDRAQAQAAAQQDTKEARAKEEKAQAKEERAKKKSAAREARKKAREERLKAAENRPGKSGCVSSSWRDMLEAHDDHWLWQVFIKA